MKKPSKPKHVRHQRPLPPGVDRLIDRRAVAAITGISTRVLYEMCASGAFPSGFLLGPMTRRWSLTEVEAWVARAKAGAFAGQRPDYAPRLAAARAARAAATAAKRAATGPTISAREFLAEQRAADRTAAAEARAEAKRQAAAEPKPAKIAPDRRGTRPISTAGTAATSNAA